MVGTPDATAAAIDARTSASVPPAIAAASRTSDTEAVSRASSRRAHLADDLAATVAQRTLPVLGEPRRKLFRKRAKMLQHGQHGRKLCTLGAVLDLHGDPDAVVDDGDGMHTLRADLRDDATFGRL